MAGFGYTVRPGKKEADEAGRDSVRERRGFPRVDETEHFPPVRIHLYKAEHIYKHFFK